MSKTEARGTPHEFTLSPDPYKSGLVCAVCGLLRRDPIHVYNSLVEPEASTILVTREHAFRAAQNAVRNQGYAVALHGSQVKDLDLVAIPWQQTAIDADACAEFIAHAIPGELFGGVEVKSYGRRAYMIQPEGQYGFDRWWIDLSVMPRGDGVDYRPAT